MCFSFWIFAVLSDGIQTSFVFEKYFYFLFIPTILVPLTNVISLQGVPASYMML